MVGLETFEKKPSKASKILSMSIELLRSTESSHLSRQYGVKQKRAQHEAVSHYRILGWMKKKSNEPTADLWRLYLQKGPTGYAAEKVEREIK